MHPSVPAFKAALKRQFSSSLKPSFSGLFTPPLLTAAVSFSLLRALSSCSLSGAAIHRIWLNSLQCTEDLVASLSCVCPNRSFPFNCSDCSRPWPLAVHDPDPVHFPTCLVIFSTTKSRFQMAVTFMVFCFCSGARPRLRIVKP